MMKTDIKVAGTTFHPLPKGVGIAIEGEFMEDTIPCAYAQVILVPEPENKYDPEAVKVMVKLNNGMAHQIGYLPAKSPAKVQIAKNQQFLLATCLIKDYTQVGKNASYHIVEIKGLPEEG